MEPNGGVLYVQNARPDGPAAWMLSEVVDRCARARRRGERTHPPAHTPWAFSRLSRPRVAGCACGLAGASKGAGSRGAGRQRPPAGSGCNLAIQQPHHDHDPTPELTIRSLLGPPATCHAAFSAQRPSKSSIGFAQQGGALIMYINYHAYISCISVRVNRVHDVGACRVIRWIDDGFNLTRKQHEIVTWCNYPDQEALKDAISSVLRGERLAGWLAGSFLGGLPSLPACPQQVTAGGASAMPSRVQQVAAGAAPLLLLLLPLLLWACFLAALPHPPTHTQSREQ